MIIAFAGKGGVGKSTISSQLIRELSKRDLVLAVDADPNSNLCDKLGLNVIGSIGGLRNDIVADPDMIPASVSKQDYIRTHVREIMTEGDRVDLLVMGRPEGEGCYCFTNDVLKDCFTDLVPGYKFTVIDNEAGMEHLSRRVLPKADVLVFVSDMSMTGVRTACRLTKLADEVKIDAPRRVLIINNVTGAIPDGLIDEAAAFGLKEVIAMPHDDYISQAAARGDFLDVPEGTPFGKAIKDLAERLTTK
jgi:CO dehydrogenase maturation factor